MLDPQSAGRKREREKGHISYQGSKRHLVSIPQRTPATWNASCHRNEDGTGVSWLSDLACPVATWDPGLPAQLLERDQVIWSQDKGASSEWTQPSWEILASRKIETTSLFWNVRGLSESRVEMCLYTLPKSEQSRWIFKYLWEYDKWFHHPVVRETFDANFGFVHFELASVS